MTTALWQLAAALEAACDEVKQWREEAQRFAEMSLTDHEENERLRDIIERAQLQLYDLEPYEHPDNMLLIRGRTELFAILAEATQEAGQ